MIVIRMFFMHYGYSHNHDLLPYFVLTVDSFILLEGSDRYGGRVHELIIHNETLQHQSKQENPSSSSSQGKDSHPISSQHIVVQLGANWIHGLVEERNPMYSYAKKLNLSLQETSSDESPGLDVLLMDRLAHDQTRLIPDDIYRQILEKYLWIQDNLESYRGDDITLGKGLELSILACEKRFGLSDVERGCLNWFLDRLHICLATRLDNISLQDYIDSEEDGEGGEALVLGGYYQIIRHLVDEYPIPIRYNHIVKSIATHHTEDSAHESDTNKILIECSNGKKFIAEKCILTVSVGVLQNNQIYFHPKEPEVIRCIKGLFTLGLMNTVWIWFPYSFWPGDFKFIGVARQIDEKIQFSTILVPEVHDNHGERQAVLMCQVVDDLAISIESLDDNQTAKLLISELQLLFPMATIPEPISCKHSSWGSDPFVKGSWAYVNYPSPYTVDDFHRLNRMSMESCGLAYAGEAVGKCFTGTVHAAYISGIDTARELLSHVPHTATDIDIEKLCTGSESDEETDSRSSQG